VAVIETAKGTMEVEFYADDAPQTVTNFVKNAQLEFYNNETFHRVEPGLIIQAGSRFVQGAIPIEQNSRELVKGAVVMVKPEGANTSDASQFFICLDKLEAEGQTVFGKVTKGLDMLDKIALGDKIMKITIRAKG
jgi:peptidyl-prolyl cis-trans isomerase B (cyclophilin B)